MAWRGLYVRQQNTNDALSQDKNEKIEAYVRRGRRFTTITQNGTTSENDAPQQIQSNSTSCEQLNKMQQCVKVLEHQRNLDVQAMGKLTEKVHQMTRKVAEAETQLEERTREMEVQQERLRAGFERERAQIRSQHEMELLTLRLEIGTERNQALRERDEALNELRRTIQSSVTRTPATPGRANRSLLENRMECRICFDNDVSIVFNPCGHSVCSICSESIAYRCHVCRKLIHTRLNLYI